MNISIYRNISDVDSQSYITFDKIYEILKTPNTIIQPLIENYRKTGDKSIKTYKLPCFVASGEFWYRNSNSLKSYSDVVFLDLDHLDNVNEIKKMVCSWDITFMCFISPSGDGLKIGVRHTNNRPEYHENLCLQLISRFTKIFGDKVDGKCKDLARATYFSYDPETYYNPNSRPFEFTYDSSIKPKEIIKEKTINSLDINIDLESKNQEFQKNWKDNALMDWLEKYQWANKDDYKEGKTHDSLMIRSLRLFKYGVSYDNALSKLSRIYPYFCKKIWDYDYPVYKVKSVLNYVYSTQPKEVFGSLRGEIQKQRDNNIENYRKKHKLNKS